MQQEPGQNENENHLIGNILAEDNSDSDIEDGGSIAKIMGSGGGAGIGSGSGNSAAQNNNAAGFGGTGQKLGGFGGAAGFGSIGSNAPYGGAFNNSGIPERVGSTPSSDLNLKYFGQHESPLGKKAFVQQQTNLTGATFSNLFAKPTDQYDIGEPLMRRPSDNGGIFGTSSGANNNIGLAGGQQSQQQTQELKSLPLHSFLTSIQQNAVSIGGQASSQDPNVISSNQQKFNEGSSNINQVSNLLAAAASLNGDQSQNQQDIYRTKEYYDYYHNLKPKDPRMPLPIYIPEPIDQTKRGQTSGASTQGGNVPVITTEEIEKKLSQLNFRDESDMSGVASNTAAQSQFNPIYQKLQGLQTGQETMAALQQMQNQNNFTLQYQQLMAASQQQQLSQQTQSQQTVFGSNQPVVGSQLLNNYLPGNANQINFQNQAALNQNTNGGATAASQNAQQNNSHNQSNANNNGGGNRWKKKGGRGGANNVQEPPPMPKPGQSKSMLQPPVQPLPPQQNKNIISLSNNPVNSNMGSAVSNNINIPLQSNNSGGSSGGPIRIAGYQRLSNQQNTQGINSGGQLNQILPGGVSQQEQQKIQQSSLDLGYNQGWPMGHNQISGGANSSLFPNQINPSVNPLAIFQQLNAAQNAQNSGVAQSMFPTFNLNNFNQSGSNAANLVNQQAQSLFPQGAQTAFGNNPQGLLNPLQQLYVQMPGQGGQTAQGLNPSMSQIDPMYVMQQQMQFMKTMMLNNQTNQGNNNLLGQALVGGGSQMNLQGQTGVGGGGLLGPNNFAQAMLNNMQSSNFNQFGSNQLGMSGLAGTFSGQQNSNPLQQLLASQQINQNNGGSQQNAANNNAEMSNNQGTQNFQKKNNGYQGGQAQNNSQQQNSQHAGGNQGNPVRGSGANQRGQGRGSNQAANNFNSSHRGSGRGGAGLDSSGRGGAMHPMEYNQSNNGGSNGFPIYAPVSQANNGSQQMSRGQSQQYDMMANDMAMSNVVQVAKSEFLEDLRNKIQNGKKIEIRDIKDHVVECSMDQYGSRFIQQKYDVTTEEEKELIFSEILPEANSLMNDVFGNYVVQKLFEYGTDIQTAILAEQLLGNVLKLTKSMYGCRVVQKALEVISLDQQKLLVQELKDAVLDCIYDQNGNHVIQKCIEKMPNEAIDFIVLSVSEQSKVVVDLCLHTYGCRVIQRILENCLERQTRPIIDFILADIAILTKDQFGNYVIQHILENGKYIEDKNRIVKSIKGRVIELSNHKFASNVVEKCLQHGSDKDKKEIIDEFLESNYELGEEITNLGGGAQLNGALYTMMKDRYGNYVIQKCIEVSKGKQRDILVKKITACANVLRKQANYSRHVYNFIEKFSPEGIAATTELTAANNSEGGQMMQSSQHENVNNGGRNAHQQYHPRGGARGGGNHHGSQQQYQDSNSAQTAQSNYNQHNSGIHGGSGPHYVQKKSNNNSQNNNYSKKK